MSDFIVGIDDIGTMGAQCSGWTIVTFEKKALNGFDKRATEIISSSGLSSFHAQAFKRRKKDFYLAFLSLIRETLESHKGFICCTLLGFDWKSDFESFCSNVISGAFSQAGINDVDTITAAKHIAAPLFTFQRIANSKCDGGTTTIHIDRDYILDNLESSKFLNKSSEISSKLPVIAALRAYGQARFPNAPEVVREGIKILPDEHSFMVQAADMIGNFSTALVFQHLGKVSNSNDLKSSIFQEVFGDIIDLSTLPNAVSMNGDDLELQPGSASFTFHI